MLKIVFCFIGVFLLTVPETCYGQEVSPFIVIDQFGYQPESKKVAVIRDPHTGFDSDQSFTPGNSYVIINDNTKDEVFASGITAWKNGAIDQSSGDKVWHFDFSDVTTVGSYYVLDKVRNVKSYSFKISESVYNDVLRQAVRAFFYQRAGFEKSFPYADQRWADGASHLGALQDTEAHKYSNPNSSSQEKDVSGGWYDAGDYNKYTNWTANYVVDFMLAYLENPQVWGDDYNLPESGNGIPDLLDEAKWGIDHLLRMQQTDGSVLSIVGLGHASPPSSATGQSLYGSASTSATLNTAAAFALSCTLSNLSQENPNWAEANSDVLFYNNDAQYGTSGLGAGQQETDDYGRLMAKLEAAVFLLDITGEGNYKTFFDNYYDQAHLITWNWASPFETTNQETLLYYLTIEGGNEVVQNEIATKYQSAMKSHFDNYENLTDPYLAYMDVYVWGSNSVKSAMARMFLDLDRYGLQPDKHEKITEIAQSYLHYLHGVNPLSFVYLSNMYDYGGDQCVNEFYHSWFTDGSGLWDRVGESKYGPAPGFLVGGPNPSYEKDGCCPDNCGGSNNAKCNSESLSPPLNQPEQKSYKDFNPSWPLNSWSVTENSNGYQLNYIRLLSNLVGGNYDCHGDKDGSANFDACGRCSGGNTGIESVTDPSRCAPVLGTEKLLSKELEIFPNPTSGNITVRNHQRGKSYLQVIDSTGKLIEEREFRIQTVMDVSQYPSGIYQFKIYSQNSKVVKRMVKI